jgi:glycosyltransferase involved in cell wall biosynthesis
MADLEPWSLSNQSQGTNRKKILFISTLTPPYGGSAMSSEMCLQILREDTRFEVKNIKLNYSLDMADMGKVNFKKVYGLFQVRKQIRVLLKQFKPDIVYFVPATTGLGLLRDYFFLKVIKRLKKGKLVLHLRMQFKKEYQDNRMKKFIVKDLLDCDKLIVLGPELLENLKKIVLNENIYILPNAIPNVLSDSEFEKIPIQRNLTSNLHLLFLSNMHEAKGWFKVLEACKLLNDSEIKFECHFVGEWTSKTDSKKFYEYIEKNNLLDNIIFHGLLLNEEKNKILEISDILLFPSENEAFGRVIIEAMEFGLVVIANATGTIPSIIKHGETGYLLQQNTANEIVGYILKLLDPSRRYTMGLNGRLRFLERFTIDTYKNRFIEILNGG